MFDCCPALEANVGRRLTTYYQLLAQALRIVSTGFCQMAIILSVDILRCTIDVAILWPDVKMGSLLPWFWSI